MIIENRMTEDEIQSRLSEYSRTGDTSIRDEVVLQYAHLVESVARRFVGASEPLEDLVQEGCIGLINSVDKYDTDKGVKFSTYATHFIIGQIKHYLRDKGKIIKEPAWLQELNQRMAKAIESLNQELGRQPNEEEIALIMELPEKNVRDILSTREVFKVSSLDGGDREDSAGPSESEKITEDKMVIFSLPIEDKIVLAGALDKLKDVEKNVISDHFYNGLNQTEIAKRLGISCNYVSHLLKNGTRKLRKILSTEEIKDSQIQKTLETSRNVGDDNLIIDPITTLFNKRYFIQRLDEEISRAYRNSHKIAIMLLDVCIPDEVDKYVKAMRMDDFLYHTGQLMRLNIRKMDVLARYENERFAFILPHTSANIGTVEERMASLVSTMKIETGRKNQKVNAYAQTSYAIYSEDGLTAEELISSASERLDKIVNESSYSFEMKKAA